MTFEWTFELTFAATSAAASTAAAFAIAAIEMTAAASFRTTLAAIEGETKRLAPNNIPNNKAEATRATTRTITKAVLLLCVERVPRRRRSADLAMVVEGKRLQMEAETKRTIGKWYVVGSS